MEILHQALHYQEDFTLLVVVLVVFLILHPEVVDLVEEGEQEQEMVVTVRQIPVVVVVVQDLNHQVRVEATEVPVS
jgi:hypothetical protein